MKKKIDKPVVLENLRNRRKEKGYSQQAIAEVLDIGQDTYSDYELGKNAIPSNILVKLSEVLDISTDYLLGVPNAPLHIGNKELSELSGLNENAIENLRTLKESYLNELARALAASEGGIVYTPYNPIELLNHVINSPAFEGLLNAIENYIDTDYCRPVFFMDATQSPDGKAGYHVPHNPIHEQIKKDKKGRVVLNDNLMPAYNRYIPLAKENGADSDNRRVPINDSFLESVAMIQIQKAIDTIKSEYLNQPKNGAVDSTK